MIVYTLTEVRCSGLFADLLGCSGSSRVVGAFSSFEAARKAAQKIETGAFDVR
jgi:hypothetical protein